MYARCRKLQVYSGDGPCICVWVACAIVYTTLNPIKLSARASFESSRQSDLCHSGSYHENTYRGLIYVGCRWYCDLIEIPRNTFVNQWDPKLFAANTLNLTLTPVIDGNPRNIAIEFMKTSISESEKNSSSPKRFVLNLSNASTGKIDQFRFRFLSFCFVCSSGV